MATLQKQQFVVSVEEAIRHLCEGMSPGRAERLDLEDCVGRVLAEDFLTPFPMPPFRRAAMDGYAVRSNATIGAKLGQETRLRVIAEIKAGVSREWVEECTGGIAIEDADCVRIFTGAPVPHRYDTVVMQEAVTTSIEDDGRTRWIGIDRPHPSGKHVAEAGEDLAPGKLILVKGTVIGAKEMAVLASYGQRDAVVYAKPRIAVLPVGDELLEPGAALSANRIYDANSLAVYAFLKQLGAHVIRRKPVPDQLAVLTREIEQAAEQADIVITTGGISVGDHDYVERAAASAGFEPVFTKVLMRPGTPTSAFKKGNCLLLGLSGNPSACYSGLELLVKPTVQWLKGMKSYRNQWLKGKLEDSVGKPCPYPRYIRSIATMELGMWRINPLPNDKSGNIAAFAEANAIAVIPAGGRGAAKGEIVSFLLLTHMANGGLTL
ncbi:molybdopterin molybdotransferase MoeA [Paenibacillus glycanilyticus]|uniref:Molybdopterin molybdenumtransferase n=1 Tax=Paenibacillus glycanilyticus TaxID=126569 RepID=A0ABQ6GE31_9BACL|nr:gephyrin-like molybdotransferase Glp [Paenibacillus glycanilyticus]GLX69219.1 molybdopterin molybdenumtransferase [Paenibacillus glycanilyticus]